MDTNEIIALSIVAVAALLIAKYFFRKKDGGNCGPCCSKPTEKKK